MGALSTLSTVVTSAGCAMPVRDANISDTIATADALPVIEISVIQEVTLSCPDE